MIMSISEKVNLVIYRFQKKGLEIFLVNEKDAKWDIPKTVALPFPEEEIIELDPVEIADGQVEKGLAVEGDWHDIPSLKSLIAQDAMNVKDKIKKVIPELQKGKFVVIKDAFKIVLSHQHKMLEELKEILTDRNSIKDL